MDLLLTRQETAFRITWSADEVRRWGTAMTRASLLYRKLATTDGAAVEMRDRIQAIQSDVEAAKVPGQTESTGVTFETSADPLRCMTFMAVAEVAAVELLDDAVPNQVHADLMAGTFGGQVNSYYRPQVAEKWTQDGARFAGSVPTVN